MPLRAESRRPLGSRRGIRDSSGAGTSSWYVETPALAGREHSLDHQHKVPGTLWPAHKPVLVRHTQSWCCLPPIGGSDGMPLWQIDNKEIRRVQVLGPSKRRHTPRLTTALLRLLHHRSKGLRGLPVECSDSGRPDIYAHASPVFSVSVPVEPHRNQRLDVTDMTWRTFERAIKAANSGTIDLDRHLVATPRRPVVVRLHRWVHPLRRVWYPARPC